MPTVTINEPTAAAPEGGASGGANLREYVETAALAVVQVGQERLDMSTGFVGADALDADLSLAYRCLAGASREEYLALQRVVARHGPEGALKQIQSAHNAGRLHTLSCLDFIGDAGGRLAALNNDLGDVIIAALKAGGPGDVVAALTAEIGSLFEGVIDLLQNEAASEFNLFTEEVILRGQGIDPLPSFLPENARATAYALMLLFAIIKPAASAELDEADGPAVVSRSMRNYLQVRERSK